MDAGGTVRHRTAHNKGLGPEAASAKKGTGQKGKASGAEDKPPAQRVPVAKDVSEPDEVSRGREVGSHGRGFWRKLRLSSSVSSRGEGTPAVREVDVALWGLMAVAAATRLWNIGQPKYTVFDEVHFGKFSSLYLQGRHFFDVHPPLGKLLFAAVGYLCGYHGEFLFDKINMEYPPVVPYVAMRSLSAAAGIALVPCVFHIMRELGFSYVISYLAAFFVVFDNALVIQSRVIMLDSMAILFTFLTILFYLKFCNCQRSWSGWWYLYLFLSAVSLGSLMGIKYTGILGMVFLGGLVLVDLYQLVADRSVLLHEYLGHFLLRGSVLVGVPLLMNIALFYVHFALMTQAGIHDGWLPQAVKAQMEGTQLKLAHDPNSTMLRYGSKFALRHAGSNCWLHSHDAVYPLKYEDGRGSSHQQHVTCYEFRDTNNLWVIRRPGSPDDPSVPPDHGPVRHGDVVELVHAATQKLLNSHDVAAPLTPQFQEIAGYINYSAKFVPHLRWTLEVQHDAGNYPIYWQPGKVQVTMKHEDSGQLLTTTGKRLPEWGFKQLEAVTSKSADVLSSLWHIEELEVAGADLSQPNSQSSGITGDSDSSEGEGEESSSEGEAEESSSEGEGEESSAGGSDGVGVANKSDEAKTEGEPSTDIGEDATNEAMELKDEEALKPPLPSGTGSVEGPATVSFWQQYVMVQGQMFGAHGSMSEHSYGSRPQQWILLQKTLPYWLDSATNSQVTLVGNPILWYEALAACLLLPLLLLGLLLRRQRQHYDIPEGEFFQLSFAGPLLLAGWAVHTLPYFAISRVLFLHHYLPALPFKYMLLAALIEHTLNLLHRLSTPRRCPGPLLVGAVVLSVLSGFAIFAPFVYATPLTEEVIMQRHWVKSWDFLFHKSAV